MGPSVFLAGPTPDKSAPVPSWRPQAADALAARWTGAQPRTILVPNSGAASADRYETQVDCGRHERGTVQTPNGT